MGRPLEHVDQGGLVILEFLDGDGAVGVEAKDGFVDQGQAGTAVVQHPDFIPRAEGVIQPDRLPLPPPGRSGFHRSLHGDRLGRPWVAVRHGSGRKARDTD